MRRTKVALLTVSLLVSLACIKKAGTAPVTPREKVMVYNAALADGIDTVEKGAEGVVAAQVITPAQAAPIISWCGEVATIHEQITAILAQTTITTANVASVQALVDQIKASALAIPPEALGIKNPKSVQTFQADVATVGSLADAVMIALKGLVP